MMCTKPPRVVGGSVPWPCGQCLACRINRARKWQLRLILEWLHHGFGYFVTLTYNPENLPAGGVLVKEDVQKFLKRLRFNLGVSGLRYFAVGEYGTVSWRPHYHLLIFGTHVSQEQIEKAWTAGFSKTGLVSVGGLAYCVGYCLKKLTRPSSSLPKGLTPEFMLSSRRPGIGALASDTVARSLRSILPEIDARGLPGELRVEGEKFPLDRYMKLKLKEVLQEDVDFTDKLVEHARRIVASMMREDMSPEEREARRRFTAARAMRKLTRRRQREAL